MKRFIWNLLFIFSQPLISASKQQNKQDKKKMVRASVEMLNQQFLSIFPSKSVELGTIVLSNVMGNNKGNNAEPNNAPHQDEEDILIKIKYKNTFETTIPLPHYLLNESSLSNILVQFFAIITSGQSKGKSSLLDAFKTEISSFEIIIYKRNLEVLVKTYLVNLVRVTTEQGIKEINLLYTAEDSVAYSMTEDNRQITLKKIAVQLLTELKKNLDSLKENDSSQ